MITAKDGGWKMMIREKFLSKKKGIDFSYWAIVFVSLFLIGVVTSGGASFTDKNRLYTSSGTVPVVFLPGDIN